MSNFTVKQDDKRADRLVVRLYDNCHFPSRYIYIDSAKGYGVICVFYRPPCRGEIGYGYSDMETQDDDLIWFKTLGEAQGVAESEIDRDMQRTSRG